MLCVPVNDGWAVKVNVQGVYSISKYDAPTPYHLATMGDIGATADTAVIGDTEATADIAVIGGTQA